MTFKNLKNTNNNNKNEEFQRKGVRKVSQVHTNVVKPCDDDDESEEEEVEGDSSTSEEESGGCEDCNNDDDSDDVLENEPEIEQVPIKPNNKKHGNSNMQKLAPVHQSSNSNSQLKSNNIKAVFMGPSNLLKGGQKYYNNRAMDARWRSINSNNRFKGGYRENMGKPQRLLNRNAAIRNGKRKIKQFTNIAG